MKRTIEASAGTGKTFELTTIVAAALAGEQIFDGADAGSGLIHSDEFRAIAAATREGVLDSSEIVLVTFTETATRELHHRVRGRLAELLRRTVPRPCSPRERARLEEGLRQIDTMSISTIHGFCARVIRDHAFELGISGLSDTIVDEETLAAELVMRWWSRRVRDDAQAAQLFSDRGIDLTHLLQVAKGALGSRGIPLARIEGHGIDARLSDLIASVQMEASNLLRERGEMTFQDQLVIVLEAVRSRPALADALRQRYRLAVVDEAQDTDPVQLEIFETLFNRPGDRERLLVLVGDPKQSIFAFRGADLDTYLRLRGAEAPLRLDINRRSSPGVVEAVNQLFSQPNPFVREGIEHPPVRADSVQRHGEAKDLAPFEVHFGSNAEDPVAWTIRVLKQLVGSNATINTEGRVRRLRWSDCAVLGRSNDALAELDAALRTEGVPTVLLGDQSVFRSDLVGELRAILRACAEPGRAASVRRAMVSRIVGVAALDLAAPDAATRVAQWSDTFARWAEESRRSGILGIVERAIEHATGTITSRDATDALHLAELIHAETGPGVSPSAMITALDALHLRSLEESTRPGDRLRRRIDHADAVTIQTIHASKGLEYGVVLVPWAGQATSSRKPPMTVRVPCRDLPQIAPELVPPPGVPPEASVLAQVPMGLEPQLLRDRAVEEAIRLFYVAVTRARFAVRIFAQERSKRSDSTVLDLLGVTDADNPWPPVAVESAPAPPPAPVEGTKPITVRPRLTRPLRSMIDTSFTRLTAGAEEHEPEALAATDDFAERLDEPAPIVTRDALSGGRYLGRVMHRIFEWAAQLGAAANMDELAERAVQEAGMAESMSAPLLAELARRTRAADLAVVGGPATTLAAIPPARAATELAFCLPLGQRARVTPAALAAACAQASAGSVVARFAPVAERLSFGEVEGFLRGTIDLLVECEGRWWIVDYKTNDLGEHDVDYRAARLDEEMIRDRYVLQYLLYAVAARRLLRWRGLPAAGEWFGGVIYPFVRGIDPREPGRGLFVDRPDDAVLEALDALAQGRPMQSAGEGRQGGRR
ncbi:MAG: UvrD-helicase domain-containing protein [Phycisphaeraceae bacterium]|nr:UvrD-helicase domain-containing protein [Phycisphaeraceae bacterium]